MSGRLLHEHIAAVHDVDVLRQFGKLAVGLEACAHSAAAQVVDAAGACALGAGGGEAFDAHHHVVHRLDVELAPVVMRLILLHASCRHVELACALVFNCKSLIFAILRCRSIVKDFLNLAVSKGLRADDEYAAWDDDAGQLRAILE